MGYMVMRYHTGDRVYVRGHASLGPLPIAGLEFKWQGAVERVSFCRIRTGAGIIRVPVCNVLSPGEAVAETLLKGKIHGR